MRIYVAAKFGSAAKAKEVAEFLEKDGHTITHKWWEVKEEASWSC